MRMVLAEDDVQAVRRIQRLLAQIGIGELVGIAADGLRAVEVVEELKPDLLFLDLDLPRLCGLEVLERLKHRPAVVVTTSHTEMRRHSERAPVVDFLCKPLELAPLRRAIEKVHATLVTGGGCHAVSENTGS